MIKKTVFALLAIMLVSQGVISAQEAWSLEKCINYAFENNISIKRQKVNAEYQENQLKQSKNDRLPDLGASTDYGVNFGLVGVRVDENFFYTTDPTHNLSVSTGGSVSVFSGSSLKNTIKKNEKDLLASQATTEKMMNDIALQITGHYLQILFDKELLAVAKEQFEVSNQQAERTKKLVDAGSQAMGNYLEIKSQAAKEALNVTQQENNLALSLLNLAQLLDLEEVVGFDVVYPEIPEISKLQLNKPSEIYRTALGIMPEIKSSQYQLESSEYDVKLAKSGFYPSINFNYNWRSNGWWFIDDNFNANIPFSDQFSDNRNTYLGASMRIPIFSKMQNKTRVKNAKIGVLDATYKLEQDKLTLRKEIQQAYADAMASYNKYLSSTEAVESFKESFRYTEQKFNVGLVNSVDYNVAKTDFTRAQSDLLQSRYEYILRNKILDFYKGIPIEL
ncbi:TolC family protein [Labilibacter sediminis]|nr:TolC family protein [Labilibacter sediminis]